MMKLIWLACAAIVAVNLLFLLIIFGWKAFILGVITSGFSILSSAIKTYTLTEENKNEKEI